jgi:hypothetical protein
MSCPRRVKRSRNDSTAHVSTTLYVTSVCVSNARARERDRWTERDREIERERERCGERERCEKDPLWTLVRGGACVPPVSEKQKFIKIISTHLTQTGATRGHQRATTVVSQGAASLLRAAPAP